jgi:hypothetical protein
MHTCFVMSKADDGVAESHHICATVACKGLSERQVSTVMTNQAEGTLIASKQCHDDFVL